MGQHSPLLMRPGLFIYRGIPGPVTFEEYNALPGSMDNFVHWASVRKPSISPPGPKPRVFGPGTRYNVKATLKQIGELIAAKTFRLTSISAGGSEFPEDADAGVVVMTPGVAPLDDENVGDFSISGGFYDTWGHSRQYDYNSFNTAFGDHRDIGGSLITRGMSTSGGGTAGLVDENNDLIGEDPGSGLPNFPSLLGPAIPYVSGMTYGGVYRQILFGSVFVSFYVGMPFVVLNDVAGDSNFLNPSNELWIEVDIYCNSDFAVIRFTSRFDETGDGFVQSGVATIILPSGNLEVPLSSFYGPCSATFEVIPYDDL